MISFYFIKKGMFYHIIHNKKKKAPIKGLKIIGGRISTAT
ncbi:hypothetical protein Javan88_0034 [Streptococcus phage Javan88]|nr:hypothetical protein Javan91_0031 [Streptococcus phage Javan91]QBX31969.1 hypothetical protein Javan88_0034 [Streptococcus phage Javan88]